MAVAERGLIFNEEWEGNLSERQIRAWVLFWDELVATNPPSQWDMLPWGATLLQKEGILSRLPLGTGADDSILVGHSDPLLVAFRDLERLSPGKWSVATPTDESSLYSNDGRCILVSLYDALPVPTRDVPLEDVIDFRRRRRDEQLAIRHHVETIYDRIIRSPDRAMSFNRELSDLASSAADAVAVLEEARIPYRWAGIEAKLSWSFDFTPAAVGAAVGALVSLPAAAAGASIGLVANLMPKIEISTAAGLPPHRSDPGVPFAYMVQMANEL